MCWMLARASLLRRPRGRSVGLSGLIEARRGNNSRLLTGPSARFGWTRCVMASAYAPGRVLNCLPLGFSGAAFTTADSRSAFLRVSPCPLWLNGLLSMTTRLYYNDSFLYDFDAEVREVVEGPRPGLILDRTAFYPTSGGQVFDTGWITSEAKA